MEVRATEFPTANEAIQEAAASGFGVALRLRGRFFVMAEEEADRLAAAGVRFSYLGEHALADGSFVLMTVPVN
jgi:hypothetical protein